MDRWTYAKELQFNDAELADVIATFNRQSDEGPVGVRTRRWLRSRAAAIDGPVSQELAADYWFTGLDAYTAERLGGVPPGLGGDYFGQRQTTAGCGCFVSCATPRELRNPPLLCPTCSGAREWSAALAKRAVYNGDYLFSGWWRSLSHAYKAKHPNCEDCGAPADDVHHLRYTNLGAEPDEDLIALCRKCHHRRHGTRFEERR